ncbi:hypothetical protein [Amycolatopsis thermoflava]|uniref:hypothetical protein n=1 Tax=Amycolatopsis thermoflava TaxID=84480 RepID=UPI003D74DAE1
MPGSVWWDAIRGLVTPATPPEGITATLLLNFLFFGFFFVNFVYELFTGGALVEF